MSHVARLALCGACLYTLAVPASAAQELVINIAQTQILETSAKPGTIIIGAPGVVDASMQGGKIFLQGKGYGSTNIIILDRKGAEIGNYEVTVKRVGSNDVAIYKAGERYSYVCAPNCEAAPQVGDNSNYVYTTLGAQGATQSFAMQSTSTESTPTNGGATDSGQDANAN